MATTTINLSTTLDRNQLLAIFSDLRTVKAFEALLRAVTITIPDVVNTQSDMIGSMGESAQEVADLTRAARAGADRVAQALNSLQDALLSQRTERSTIQALQRRVEALEALLLTGR